MSGTSVPAQTWSWSVQSGSLPTGLGLNGTTGAPSGTPTIAGTYNFIVKAATAKPGGNPELEFSTYNLDVNPGKPSTSVTTSSRRMATPAASSTGPDRR